MKLWLTRQSNGLHMLTYYKPGISNVAFSKYDDAYVQPREPIGLRNLCNTILILLGVTQKLKKLETVEVDITEKEADFYVTRQANGLYMVTYFPPTINKVLGSEIRDVYIVPGEPIGIRNLSDKLLLFSNFKGRLKRLETAHVKISGAFFDKNVESPGSDSN